MSVGKIIDAEINVIMPFLAVWIFLFFPLNILFFKKPQSCVGLNQKCNFYAITGHEVEFLCIKRVIFNFNLLDAFLVLINTRQKNTKKLESCVGLSQILIFIHNTACEVKFYAIPGAPAFIYFSKLYCVCIW